MIVHVRSYPQGPRCWIAGQRVHHGAVGVATFAAGLAARHLPAVIVGLSLCLHDAHDWRAWFMREPIPAGINHMEGAIHP